MYRYLPYVIKGKLDHLEEKFEKIIKKMVRSGFGFQIQTDLKVSDSNPQNWKRELKSENKNYR
jgi:hypothetical protein